MLIPNAASAFVDLAKLRDYSLSTTHPEGKHKARVFAAALGLVPEDAPWLRDQLLLAARELPCELGRRTAHGQRYSVELTLRKGAREARVCSAWIIRPGEDFPRLVSCYVV